MFRRQSILFSLSLHNHYVLVCALIVLLTILWDFYFLFIWLGKFFEMLDLLILYQVQEYSSAYSWGMHYKGATEICWFWIFLHSHNLSWMLPWDRASYHNTPKWSKVYSEIGGLNFFPHLWSLFTCLIFWLWFIELKGMKIILMKLNIWLPSFLFILFPLHTGAARTPLISGRGKSWYSWALGTKISDRPGQ